MTKPLSKEILQGLATCRWLGRNQIVDTAHATYYLDGAQYVRTRLFFGIHFRLYLYRLVRLNQ